MAVAILLWFHRWLGVTTCVIVAAWFASGAVLLFVPFPSLSRTAQLTLEAPLDVRSVTVPPAVAIRTVGGQASGLRLINRAGRSSYVVMVPAGAVAVDARTGTLLANLSPSSASEEAKRLFGAAGTAVGPVDYDQWIVHNRFDPYRPYFRLDAHDEMGTQIWRGVDIAFDQVGAASILAHGLAGQVEHRSGWIDAREMPAGVRLGQCLQL